MSQIVATKLHSTFAYSHYNTILHFYIPSIISHIPFTFNQLAFSIYSLLSTIYLQIEGGCWAA